MRTLTKKLSRKLAAPEQQGVDLQHLEPINVVVIDPEAELGVMLKYDPDTMDAPIVADKGDGAWTQDVQVLADYDIQIVESQLLAQSLYDNCEVGQMIPDDLYSDVGEMLGAVYLLNEIATNLNDVLRGEFGSQGSTDGRSHERHPGSTTLARSRVRVSLG